MTLRIDPVEVLEINKKLIAENEKLKQLLLLTDPAVSSITIGETQLKQWEEFTKCFPEYSTR